MIGTGIIGGETHLTEITRLAGQRLQLVRAAVGRERQEWARNNLTCPVTDNIEDILTDAEIELVAIANENDRRAAVVVAALGAGQDVIVDKPLAMTMDEQHRVQQALKQHPQRRLLMLLTLRGEPLWAGLRDLVQREVIGAPMFTHVRMAVQLKRAHRPDWFLDHRRSGGLFLDLLIHGLDYVEWLTGRRIVSLSAATGNLGHPMEVQLRDHASAFCVLDNGSTAVVEGQRALPATRGEDYRVTVAGIGGYADLMGDSITVTNNDAAGRAWNELPPARSVIADWLDQGDLVTQRDSLRANYLALMATRAATTGTILAVDNF